MSLTQKLSAKELAVVAVGVLLFALKKLNDVIGLPENVIQGVLAVIWLSLFVGFIMYARGKKWSKIITLGGGFVGSLMISTLIGSFVLEGKSMNDAASKTANIEQANNVPNLNNGNSLAKNATTPSISSCKEAIEKFNALDGTSNFYPRFLPISSDGQYYSLRLARVEHREEGVLVLSMGGQIPAMFIYTIETVENTTGNTTGLYCGIGKWVDIAGSGSERVPVLQAVYIGND